MKARERVNHHSFMYPVYYYPFKISARTLLKHCVKCDKSMSSWLCCSIGLSGLFHQCDEVSPLRYLIYWISLKTYTLIGHALY